VKEISGDIVGDDSYFPRDRYPDGWEIDDMVWEYGAAISAIVLDDNTVALSANPGEKPGDRVEGVVEPATPDFAVRNEGHDLGQGGEGRPDAVRDPGSNMVVVSGSLPAKSAPQKHCVGDSGACATRGEHAGTCCWRTAGEILGKQSGRTMTPTRREASRTVLAEHMSLPLGDTLKLREQNQPESAHRDILRTAARQQGRWAKSDDLLKFPEEFYAKAGIAPGEFVVQEDGSGMSRHDLVTPRALVALLAVCAKAILVSSLLRFVAGGGNRWDDSRTG